MDSILFYKIYIKQIYKSIYIKYIYILYNKKIMENKVNFKDNTLYLVDPHGNYAE